jgi:hypothetical protein
MDATVIREEVVADGLGRSWDVVGGGLSENQGN